MSQTTIEWTLRPGTIGETLNPTTGCNKVDRGCKHCYAEIMHGRLRAMGSAKYQSEFLGGVKVHPEVLAIPYTWHKPRTVFVNSMSDLFHREVPWQFTRRFFEVMEQTPRHTYLILTKRPEVALGFAKYYTSLEVNQPLKPWPKNVWIGTSAHDQKSADLRVPQILQLPAALIFLSYEPALGPLNLRTVGTYEDRIDALNGVRFAPGTFAAEHRRQRRLDWVIMGGESGPKAEPMQPQWARDMRDQCATAKVPFFFKQWGTWEPSLQPGKMMRNRVKNHNLLDGETYQQFPVPSA
jgi:protein gp37